MSDSVPCMRAVRNRDLTALACEEEVFYLQIRKLILATVPWLGLFPYEVVGILKYPFINLSNLYSLNFQ